MLSKVLIRLSAKRWGCAPTLVVVWPEAMQLWGLQALWGTPRGTFQACCCPCPCPCGKPLPTHASTGVPPTLACSFGSVSCGVTSPFLWVLVHARFCLCPSRLESPFPSVLWKFYNQISLAFKVRFLGDSPAPLLYSQAVNPDMGFRTFTTVGKLLWYYCSPVCGSPINVM